MLRIPDSRRGVPHSIGRVEPDPPSPAYRWHTEDPQLRERMLAGFRKAEALWKTVVQYDVDVELPGFFEKPWLTIIASLALGQISPDTRGIQHLR